MGQQSHVRYTHWSEDDKDRSSLSQVEQKHNPFSLLGHGLCAIPVRKHSLGCALVSPRRWRGGCTATPIDGWHLICDTRPLCVWLTGRSCTDKSAREDTWRYLLHVIIQWMDALCTCCCLVVVLYVVVVWRDKSMGGWGWWWLATCGNWLYCQLYLVAVHSSPPDTYRAFTDVGWPISSTADFLERQIKDDGHYSDIIGNMERMVVITYVLKGLEKVPVGIPWTLEEERYWNKYTVYAPGDLNTP